MKHVLYIFYVIFYASAVFLAGLFAGQLVERKNAQKKNGLSGFKKPLNGNPQDSEAASSDRKTRVN